MANINLLPWRAELRKERNQEFYTVLGGISTVAALIAFVWWQSVSGSIEEQRRNNTYIRDEIKKVDAQITEIDSLKEQREKLIARMDAIQKLQGDRPVIVHLFDEFVRRLPEGVYFTSLSKTGPSFAITGVADSNNRISNLMRALDESKWLESPVLEKVETEPKIEGNLFSMKVKEQPRVVADASQPKAAEEDSSKKGKKGKGKDSKKAKEKPAKGKDKKTNKGA